jgi:hypothetical protein
MKVILSWFAFLDSGSCTHLFMYMPWNAVQVPCTGCDSLQVWKVEDFLAKWSAASEGKGPDDPIALILAKVCNQGWLK